MSDEPPCPCGCDMSRDEALRSLMNAPLTYMEADALLSEMFQGEPPDIRRDDDG